MTRARDDGLIRLYLNPILGDAPLARITKQDVQQAVAKMSESLSPASVRKAYSLLGAIMAEAVEHRMIPESPCRRISLPKGERVERRYLTASEVARLATHFLSFTAR